MWSMGRRALCCGKNTDRRWLGIQGFGGNVVLLIHPLCLVWLLLSFSSGDNSEQGRRLISRVFPLAAVEEHIPSMTAQGCTVECCCLYFYGWKINSNCIKCLFGLSGL